MGGTRKLRTTWKDKNQAVQIRNAFEVQIMKEVRLAAVKDGKDLQRQEGEGNDRAGDGRED